MNKKSTKNLYDKFVQNMRPYAEAQEITVEVLIERLEYRATYESRDDPDMFPAQCVCGEVLTSTAIQFDDPSSTFKRTYTLGCVCSQNLRREVARLETVSELGKYLTRSNRKGKEPMPIGLRVRTVECGLWDAAVVSNRVKSNIWKLEQDLGTQYERDEAYAEGICVAYGMVPAKAVLAYFLPDGSLW